MKKVAFALLVFMISISISSCSSDDDNTNKSKIIENLSATVKGQISCQTISNGFVYEIELDEAIEVSGGSMLKSIGITNLPENLKSNGTRIRISIRQTEFPDGLCATIYSPEYFFENTRVSSTP
ncbi:MAG: hypothetical protein CR994_05760 [Maribacter sp.]|nr:MAG: hypothetical protein CR994_05760 [Maribacter sp.]